MVFTWTALWKSKNYNQPLWSLTWAKASCSVCHGSCLPREFLMQVMFHWKPQNALNAQIAALQTRILSWTNLFPNSIFPDGFIVLITLEKVHFFNYLSVLSWHGMVTSGNLKISLWLKQELLSVSTWALPEFLWTLWAM